MNTRDGEEGASDRTGRQAQGPPNTKADLIATMEYYSAERN